MPTLEKVNTQEAIRRRLIVLRHLKTGENQSEFARWLDVHPNFWNNLERGFPLTLKTAQALAARYEGITLSYILEGYFDKRIGAKLKRDLIKKENELFGD
jgi:hypothetical protein